MGPVREGGDQPADAGQDRRGGDGPPAGPPPPARRPKAGLLLLGLLGAAALALVAVPFAARSRRASPPAPLYSKAWEEHRLPQGQEAPDFALPAFPGGGEVRLSALRGRGPVVLAFGSFTCDLFCDSLGRLAELSEAYRGRARFYLVYIAEAGHRLPFPSPEGGRLGRVRKGLEFFRVPFPCLLAPPDSQAEKDYDPWPTRLVLVGADGLVALDAGRGVRRPPWDLAGFEARLRTLAGEHEAGWRWPGQALGAGCISLAAGRPRRRDGGAQLDPVPGTSGTDSR